MAAIRPPGGTPPDKAWSVPCHGRRSGQPGAASGFGPDHSGTHPLAHGSVCGEVVAPHGAARRRTAHEDYRGRD